VARCALAAAGVVQLLIAVCCTDNWGVETVAALGVAAVDFV